MKLIGKIFAVLFSILYFFILTVLMTAAGSLKLLSGDYYTDIVKSIELNDIKVSELGNFIGNADFDENATVEDVLVSYFKEGGIDEELALSIINNDKIKEVIGNFIGDYINYSIGGEKPKIEKEDIVAVFNESDVKRLIELSPEEIDVDIDSLYNQLNELVDEITKDGGINYDNSGRNNENNISSN